MWEYRHQIPASDLTILCREVDVLRPESLGVWFFAVLCLSCLTIPGRKNSPAILFDPAALAISLEGFSAADRSPRRLVAPG